MIREFYRWRSKLRGELTRRHWLSLISATGTALAAADNRQAEISAFDLSLLDQWETPTELFFVREHFPAPAVSAQGWKVSVAGLGELSFEQLLAMQRGILNYLMSDDLAERLLNNSDKLQDRKVRPLTVAEMAQQVNDAVWARPSRTADSASWQRNLQREHVNRLALAVVRPAGDRADTRAVMRQQAQQLLKRLRSMGASADATEQAHRQDCIDTLTQALQATMVRSGL